MSRQLPCYLFATFGRVVVIPHAAMKGAQSAQRLPCLAFIGGLWRLGLWPALAPVVALLLLATDVALRDLPHLIWRDTLLWPIEVGIRLGTFTDMLRCPWLAADLAKLGWIYLICRPVLGRIAWLPGLSFSQAGSGARPTGRAPDDISLEGSGASSIGSSPSMLAMWG